MIPRVSFLLVVAVWSSLLQVTLAHCSYEVNDNHELAVRCRREKHFPDSIPSNATELDLSGCVIKELRRKDLSRFPQMRKLVVHGCHIRAMDTDAFDGNLDLRRVDLSKNPDLSSNTKIAVVCRLAEINGLLSELFFSEMKVTKPVFSAILPCLEKARLSVLDLSSNDISPLRDHIFSRMQSLEDLRLGNLQPINVRAFANLSRLHTLRLQNNELVDVPDFRQEGANSSSSLLPNLTALYLDYNRIRELPNASVGLRGLQFLNLRGNDLRYVTAEQMSELSPRLDTVFLNRNRRLRLSESSFAGSLKRLELRDCRLYFNERVRRVFGDLTNMVGLSVSMNEFDDDVFGVLFRGMPRLEYLSIEHSRLKRIPEMSFWGLFELKELTLNDNKLTTLSSAVFRDLRSLSRLSLAGNDLGVVGGELLAVLAPSLSVADFSRNPFICDCDLLPLVELINGRSVRLTNLGVEDAYVCHSPRELLGTNLTSLRLTAADCRHLSVAAKLAVLLGSTLLTVCLLAAAVYRLRWYVGYLYFVLRAKRREARERHDAGASYEYDAFVVYNRTDLSWIRDRLLPVLEERAGLRLCLHDRDWLCGRDVYDNIVQSIGDSRKTLLVLSNAFASSQWCHLEMTLAQHRLLADDRNALVSVLLERIEQRNASPRLLVLLRKQTYIEWTEDPEGQRIFWKKLLRSLRRPVHSVVRSSSAAVSSPRFADESADVLLQEKDTEMNLMLYDNTN